MIYELQDQNAKSDVRIIQVQPTKDKDSILIDGTRMAVLPVKNVVLFPNVMLPINVSRPSTMKLVREAYENETLIAVCTQKDQNIQEPHSNDIYTYGTAARVVRSFDQQDGSVTVILEGINRIEITQLHEDGSSIDADVALRIEQSVEDNDKDFYATVSNIRDAAARILRSTPNVPLEASFALKNIDNAHTLVNYVCVNFAIKIEEKQSLLEENEMRQRAYHLLEILNKEIQLIEIKENIQKKTREDMDKQQREYFLHQQMQTIQKELGDTSEKTVEDMRERAKQKKWSDNVQKVFDDELKRLERMSTRSAEYSTQQEYLEIILSLPWNEISKDNYDIINAQHILDRDHYGMDKVKERILEYLSVLKMRNQDPAVENGEKRFKAPILCFYGPPGVGKTSLGKSIAEALGRMYARISLGGLHDEAEIRGHRRTYIGALPGRVIQNIQKVGTSNPVFVLDEIDKVTADYHGDPTSALLEVLDPEQNNAFHDNYLDIDYDLSKVLFIATANTLSTIPRPLLDRMELIEITGYLQEEKVEIAKRHLIPKQLENHGITSEQLQLDDDILNQLIDGYTRESGVRSLDRQIATICRKIVKHIATNEEYNTHISNDDLITYLGKKRYNRQTQDEQVYCGVVTGLAWTQVGGEILQIEASVSQAKTPTLTLTGNLGDVMKESATIALGYIKAHYEDFNIDKKRLDSAAIHIHVPEGAIPKDGPSAGITMTTALVSALRQQPVRSHLAMTGEMTLRGKVLPVGGIKEKILAAKRAGVTDIILCVENEKDIADIPQQYLAGVRFHYVSDIQQVITIAFDNHKID